MHLGHELQINQYLYSVLFAEDKPRLPHVQITDPPPVCHNHFKGYHFRWQNYFSSVLELFI